MPILRGLVIRSQSGFYTVETPTGQYICKLRGRLKKGPRLGDLVAVGDWVNFEAHEGGRGLIEKVEPRASQFSRLAPNPQGEYEQILIANLDQVVIIFSCADPVPHLGMLDRFLVIAEKQAIPVLILANKSDLVSFEEANLFFERYTQIGYPVIHCSAKTGLGIPQLLAELAGKISLFTGPSGVGKSSLLNAIQPGLGLAARQVSQATGKGRHTTVVRELYPLSLGGYVADTPGLKALALWDVEAEELDGYFPELRSLVSQCAFSDCTHLHEPGCAVQEAVKQGKVHPERYQAYLRMRSGDDL